VGVPTNALLRQVNADPEAFRGRRVVITYQEPTPSRGYRYPGFDHFASDGE
jgi:hypothetical protein